MANDKINISSKTLREDLKKLLLEGLIEINFRKNDGTYRKMNCTLKPSLIPKNLMPKSKVSVHQNLDVLVVFDVEVNGWRSFNLTKLKYVKTGETKFKTNSSKKI